MRASLPTSCTRCGRRLQREFRFCPECGLPSHGDGVLSSEILELRRKAAESRRTASVASGSKPVAAVAWTALVLFVAAVGLVLFDRDVLDRWLPAPTAGEPVGAPPERDWEPEWVFMPKGTPYIGPPEADGQLNRARIEEDFWISKYELDNAMWWKFLQAEEENIRAAGRWSEAVPKGQGGWAEDENAVWYPPEAELHRPVRNVSANAAVLYCEWLTRRLGEPGVRITLPTGREWEYAARGQTGNDYPWGPEFWIEGASGISRDSGPVALSAFNQPTGPLTVTATAIDDRTPGDNPVIGMGTNVSEWVLHFVNLGKETQETRLRCYIRGGNFSHRAVYTSDRQRARMERLRVQDDAHLTDWQDDEYDTLTARLREEGRERFHTDEGLLRLEALTIRRDAELAPEEVEDYARLKKARKDRGGKPFLSSQDAARLAELQAIENDLEPGQDMSPSDRAELARLAQAEQDDGLLVDFEERERAGGLEFLTADEIEEAGDLRRAVENQDFLDWLQKRVDSGGREALTPSERAELSQLKQQDNDNRQAMEDSKVWAQRGGSDPVFRFAYVGIRLVKLVEPR